MTVTQTTFHDALLDGARAVPAGLSDGRGRPAGNRFSVYRNNVALSLTEALEVGFPAVRALLGQDAFRDIAGIFLRRHPPRTPMLMFYGAEFADFLAGFVPLQHLEYLPDLARLEQALRAAYHAADADPIDPAELQALPPDTLAATRLRLAPSLCLLRSSWPVHGLWRQAVEGQPAPEMHPQDTLILRPGYDPEAMVLPAGAAAFIAALHAGQPLAEAAEAGQTEAAQFDLSGALGLLLSGHAITAIQVGD
jgi:hypothetical protein